MQVYSMKDLLLSQEQAESFDQAMDKKEMESFEGKSWDKIAVVKIKEHSVLSHILNVGG